LLVAVALTLTLASSSTSPTATGSTSSYSLVSSPSESSQCWEPGYTTTSTTTGDPVPLTCLQSLAHDLDGLRLEVLAGAVLALLLLGALVAATLLS
jgi:hypothetical protein